MITADLFDRIVELATKLAENDAAMRLMRISRNNKHSHWAEVRPAYLRDLKELRRIATKGYTEQEQRDIDTLHAECKRRIQREVGAFHR